MVSKLVQNMKNGYFPQYQSFDDNFCSYTPIFYPGESIFDTFKHLQKSLTHNFGSKGIKMAAKIGKMGEN